MGGDHNKSIWAGRSIGRILVILLVLLILGQAIYAIVLRLNPELVRDDYGAVSRGAAAVISDAQEAYRKQHGAYSANLQELVGGRIDKSLFDVGFAPEFSPDIRRLCERCVYEGQAYKALIVFKKTKPATLWFVDNNGGFGPLGVLQEVHSKQ